MASPHRTASIVPVLGWSWPMAAALCVVGYGIGCGVVIAWTGFHVGHNDFWGNVALSEQVDLSSPASLYNLFYPFGYQLLLRPVASWPVIPAHLLNTALGMVLLATVWHVGSRLTSLSWGLGACMLVAVWPKVFRYVTTPGPDMAVAALAAVGLVLLFRADQAPRHRSPLLWGSLILGASALLRYHGLVLAVATIGATAIGAAAPRKHIRVALAGLFAVYALQMIVAVSAHQGPFHTGQALVFYKLIHGVDWFHVSSTTAPSSVLEVIRQSPGGFVSAYFRSLAPLLLLPAAPLLLAAVGTDPQRRRFGLVAFLTMTPYLIVVAAGGSSRGELPILWLVALSSVALAHEVAIRLAARRATASSRRLAAVVFVAGALGVLIIWGAPWLREDYGTVKTRVRANASYRQVEAVLRADAVTSAKQVFASDFSLYFPTLAGYTPRTNGTWLRVGDDAYNARFPELCATSAACLVRDARSLGVTHLVLTPAARNLSPEIGRLYELDGEALLELRGRDADFKVFRIR